jgi:tetratricopeptide (TPR) repeat protein
LASAEGFLRRAIELDSGYVAAYGALGQLYMVQGKLEAARKEFEALAAQSPKSVAAHTMVAIILQTQGNWADARDRFERILQIDPEAAVAANNLAWIYTEHGGNLDVAMHLAQTAQKRLPGVAGVSDTLGVIYYRKSLPALAISTLKVSTEIEPANPLYHYHLGLAYKSAGDAARAKSSLTRALSLKPDFDGAADAKNQLASMPASEPLSQ